MDTVIHVGEEVPDIELPDVLGKIHTLHGLRGQIVVLTFWSAECEWSQRVDKELMTSLEDWGERVVTLWIACNANEPIELIERVAAERKLPTVLVDARQQAANLYGVQITPQFFVVDGTGRLAYQGAWDDITFRNRTAGKMYVRDAVDALLAGRRPQVEQSEPYGCMLVRLDQLGDQSL